MLEISKTGRIYSSTLSLQELLSELTKRQPGSLLLFKHCAKLALKDDVVFQLGESSTRPISPKMIIG